MAQLTEQFRPLFLQYNLCLGMIDCRFLAQISSFELMICEKLFVLRASIVFFCNQGIFHLFLRYAAEDHLILLLDTLMLDS